MMKKESIIEIEKGKYINIDAGEEALASSVKCFLEKRELDNKKIKERIEFRLKHQNDFINSRKKHIVELLGIEEDDYNDLLSKDVGYLVYAFSTGLYDCFNSEIKQSWLSDVKKYMGKRFYYKVIEGYVLRNYDT